MAYTGPFPETVAQGGTGATTLTGVLTGNGTSAISPVSVTQHYVVIAGASNSMTSITPNNAGYVLVSNGTGADPSFQSMAAEPMVVTSVNNAASPYTVLATDQFLAVDSSGGAVTINIPNAPVTGKYFFIKDSTGSAATHNITITTPGGVVTIDGATSKVISTNYTSLSVVFDGSNYQIY